MQGKLIADAMRQMADVIETMPSVGFCFPRISLHATSPEEFRDMARALGQPSRREPDQHFYFAFREFACNGEIRICINREKVGTKIKVMREVEEWQCDDSILDPTPEGVAS